MLSVPFQRPVELGERSTLTDEEFATLSGRLRAGTVGDDELIFSESTAHWYEKGRPQRQTSLIVDPPNGRLPPFTTEGTRKRDGRPSEIRGPMTGPEDAPSPRALDRYRDLSGVWMHETTTVNEIRRSPGLLTAEMKGLSGPLFAWASQ